MICTKGTIEDEEEREEKEDKEKDREEEGMVVVVVEGKKGNRGVPSQTYRDLCLALLTINPTVLVVSAICMALLVANNEILKVCSGSGGSDGTGLGVVMK